LRLRRGGPDQRLAVGVGGRAGIVGVSIVVVALDLEGGVGPQQDAPGVLEIEVQVTVSTEHEGIPRIHVVAVLQRAVAAVLRGVGTLPSAKATEPAISGPVVVTDSGAG